MPDQSTTEGHNLQIKLYWTPWTQPQDPNTQGLHVVGSHIDSYYGTKFLETFIETCFKDSLKNINDDFNSTIALTSLKAEDNSVLAYFETASDRDKRVYEEDARPALLLLLARIGAALDSGEMPGSVLAGIRARHAAAMAYNHS